MEMMSRAIEDVADFRGMMDKIEAETARQMDTLRLRDAMSDNTIRQAFGVGLDRQPGENRAAHRARLKAERRARKVPA